VFRPKAPVIRRFSRRTSRFSRRGRHHGYSWYEVVAAGPAAELWRSAQESDGKKNTFAEDRAMRLTAILAVSVCGLCLLIGCSRSNDAEVSKARAEADSVRVELAKAKVEAEAARAELVKVRGDLKSARRDAIASKRPIEKEATKGKPELPAQKPQDPETAKEALKKAWASLIGTSDALRVYEWEIAALKKQPKGTGKTFASLELMLDGLPVKARPPFGRDDDRRLAANEWLSKNAVGRRLEIKRETGGVYVQPAGKKFYCSMTSYRERYVSANLFGAPHFIHLGSTAPYGFGFVCDSEQDAEKVKNQEYKILTIGGRIEQVRFDFESKYEYLQFSLAAVSLDGFQPLPGKLDQLERARSEMQELKEKTEAEIRRLEQLVKASGQ
jgi:hypothetical protein